MFILSEGFLFVKCHCLYLAQVRFWYEDTGLVREKDARVLANLSRIEIVVNMLALFSAQGKHSTSSSAADFEVARERENAPRDIFLIVNEALIKGVFQIDTPRRVGKK